MNKIYTASLIILIPALSILLAYTEGPPAGYTGSPLDEKNCTHCHGPLPAGNMQNWISTNIPPDGYTPGETYTITVTAIGIVAVKMGFQVTSETSVAKIGSFIITDPDRTQLQNTSTVTHNSAGTAVTVIPNTWSMDWEAPVSGTGALGFYVAVNETNNDGSNNGDLIFISSLEVAESALSLAENLLDLQQPIYPNPAHDHIFLNLPLHSEVKVYNNSGRKVISMIANTETLKLDVSTLVNGIYYVVIGNNMQYTRKIFIKK